MKVINFQLQAGVFALVILLILGNILHSGLIVFVLYIQFFLGIYQYITGSYLFLFRRLFGEFKIYWIAATINLIILISGAISKIDFQNWMIFGVLFVIPWLLALYFFWLSYKMYQKS